MLNLSAFRFSSSRVSKLFAFVAALMLSLALLTSCGGSNEESAGSSSDIKVTVAVAAYEAADLEAAEQQLGVPAGSSVLVATEASEFEPVVEDSEYGSYVSALCGVKAEGSSGWVYTLNGESVMEGADACLLEDGDRVEWSYMSW